MKAPAEPKNEAARISTLNALNILDTAAEERFDRITRLAKRLFDVPIALVSLVDSNRQWFKSAQGLDANETPRDISFCGHTILNDRIMVVPNATEDVRFHDNPLVTSDPAIRFYAGCPLTLGNGHNIGTLCLIDRQSREMNEEDNQLLTDLARMVTEELTALQLATTDPLTGLSNRRGFKLLANQTLNIIDRLNQPSALLVFDLNKFKQINDVYGHNEGDQTLIEFGKALVDTFRDSDVVARLGGDEFVCLLTGTSAKNYTCALKRLDSSLKKYNQQKPADCGISYSVGHVAFEKGPHQSLDDLLKRADEDMYRQKRNEPQSLDL